MFLYLERAGNLGLNKRYFDHLQRYVDFGIFNIGALRFEPRKLGKVKLLEHKASGREILILTEGRMNSDGLFIDTPPINEEGAFDAFFLETESEYIGTRVGADGKCRPEHESFSKDEYILRMTEGDDCIAVHIPQGTGLTKKRCESSYERAVEVPNPIVCILISVLCAFTASALGGLIFSFLTITLRANQNVTGLALTIFGSGIGNFFGGSLNKLAGGVGQISVSATSAAFRTNIPALASLGTIGDLLFSYGFLAYTAIILAIILQWYLNRTRSGLNLRAVGENPGTADAAGINVTLYKYLSTCIGAGIVGLGGLYYVMDYTKGTWANDGTIEGLGCVLENIVDVPAHVYRRWEISRVKLRYIWRMDGDCTIPE
jgi:hypothetical protein